MYRPVYKRSGILVEPWHHDYETMQSQQQRGRIGSAHAILSRATGAARPHTATVVPYKRSMDIVPYRPGFGTVEALTKEREFLPPNIASYSKFAPSDWTRHNLEHYASAEANRNLSEKLRAETVNLLRETDDVTYTGQKEVSKRLGERIGDIAFWSYELDNEIDKLMVETNNLAESKRILERALADTEQPLRVVQECLYFREKRQMIDLVHDKVEEQLLKEIETNKDCQDKMRQLIDRLQVQLRSNRAAQHKLEQDYHHKQDAFNIDSTCHLLSNSSQGIARHQGVEAINKNISVPSTWAEFSNRNIQQSQLERTASARLRAEVDSLIAITSNNIWLSWNNTNTAFSDRIAEQKDAQRKLHAHLSQVNQEIYEMERHIDFLKQAISAKTAPLKLAQTRLESRLHRPSIELCRDPPYLRLVNEVNDLHESIAKLEHKLSETEATLQHMVNIRSDLENELKVKANSVFIDREQCQGIRKGFPYRPPITS